MDIDLRRILVRFIGLTFALVGFILSITMPVVALLLPSARTQMPEGLRDSAKDRKQPRLTNRVSPQPHSPPQRPEHTPSLSSTETLNNDNTSQNTVLSAVSEVVVSTTLARHICSPQRCFQRACSSASAHSSVERLSTHMQRSTSLDRAMFSRNTYGNDTLLGYPLQLSPRSSIETDTHGIRQRQRPSTASAAEMKTKTRKSPRRALGLFNRKKGVKAASELGPMSSDVDSLPATPPNPSTLLPPHMHEPLYAIPSDSEDSLKQQRRRSLGELFHFKGKRKNKSEVSPLPALISGESIAHNDVHDLDDPHHKLLDERRLQPTSSPENVNPKDAFSKRCRQRKSSEPQLPPPRTRPYEAPYNFPSPLSPDAADYIRRTRETNSQRTSNFMPFTSFSTSILLPRSSRRSRSKHNDKSERRPQSASTPDVPSTAPTRRTTFNIPSVSASKPLHRRAESEELTSMGGVVPGTGEMKVEGEERTPVDEFGVRVARPRRPATASDMRPSIKRSALSV